MIVSGECGKFNPLLLECLVDASDDIKQTHEAIMNKKLKAEEIISLLLELSDKQTK